jgi:hypothetical protein
LDYRVNPDNDRGGFAIPFPLLSFPRRRESRVSNNFNLAAPFLGAQGRKTISKQLNQL